MLDLYVSMCDVNTRHSANRSFFSRGSLGEALLMYFHTPFYYEIYSPDGSVVLHGEGGAGDCLLHRRGERIAHGPTTSMSTGFINDWIYFGGDDSDELIDRLGLPTNRAFHVSDGEFIGNYIRRIMLERESREHGCELRVGFLVGELAVKLSRSERKATQNLQSGEIFDRISAVRSQMLTSLGEEWSLERMAALSGYSKSRFGALYSRYYSVSPMSELLTARIEYARGLLMYSEHSVSRIAELAGFSSVQYFSRTFKAQTGMLPSKLRRIRVSDG